MSCTAETLLEGIKMLEDERTVKVLKPEVLKLAKDEADELKTHLEVLNFGKGSGKEAAAGRFRA